MRVNERMKRVFSILLCLCMLVQNCPVMAFAATTDNLCDHHTEHTAECGYREGSAGSACTHEHSEDCYEILNCLHECGTECEQGCTHECTVENGCVRLELDCRHVHGDCGYSEGTAEVPCGHVHNENCGYAEAVAGNPCANAETDPECDHSGDCGFVAAVEGQACGHTACDDSCGYAPATQGTPCTHVCEVKVDSDDSCYKLLCSHKDGGHDDACGYAEAVEAHECHYECAECVAAPASEEPSEESSEPAPVCDCGTEDVTIHATTCAVYVAPEDSQCYCTEKCSEPNIWCDVCGVDYTACTGTDTAVGYAEGTIDLSQYSEGDTINISEDCKIIGDGNAYNIALNIVENATVTFDIGTSGVKLGAPITVADGKTLTLLVAGDAEHTVNGGISLGNGSNVIIEGDLTKENNKLTVTATGSNAGIGANNGVTAGDITIRNARVDATGSGSSSAPKVAGAGIGTAKASMGNILIVNSIVTAAGGYYSEHEAHGAAIGMGSDGVTMGNITLIDSEITASHIGEGHASIIGAGPDFAEGDRDGSDIGTMGDIIITNTDLHLSMAVSTTDEYAAMIGTGDFSGGGLSYSVNMGKIIFTDITQAQLEKMIATWSIPSDFAEYGGYVLGLGYWTHVYKYNENEKHCVGTFGGVWVSDGNGGTVQIGNDDGYYVDCKDGIFVHNFDEICGGTCSDCDVTYFVVHTLGTAATCTAKAVCSACGESYGEPLGHSTTAAGDRAADCNSKAYCSVCQSEYGDVDKTNHDETVKYENGFCPYCDAYEPAVDSNSDGYYEIGNAGQLFWFAQQVNIAGNTTANAMLTADIDLENRIWYPIGVYNDAVDASGTTAQVMFKGTLDGCGHTVSNFTATGTGSQGLVGYSDTTVVVKNLGVINATVSGWNAGAILAYKGTVENCYAIDCKVTGYTTAADSIGVYAGAVAGSQSPTVKNCFAYNCEVIAGAGMESKATLAPVGGSSVSNSYYLNVTATNGTLRTHSGEKTKTAEQFASGEVAYLLQGEQTEQVWGQTIGTDAYPVLGGEKVLWDASNGYYNDIIQVDITWGAMEFTYSTTWNPDTLQYEGGWTTDADDGGTVTVSNEGTLAVTATFDYTQTNTAVTGELSEKELSLARGESGSITLTLTGIPEEELINAELGRLTVTIKKCDSE